MNFIGNIGINSLLVSMTQCLGVIFLESIDHLLSTNSSISSILLFAVNSIWLDSTLYVLKIP